MTYTLCEYSMLLQINHTLHAYKSEHWKLKETTQTWVSEHEHESFDQTRYQRLEHWPWKELYESKYSWSFFGDAYGVYMWTVSTGWSLLWQSGIIWFQNTSVWHLIWLKTRWASCGFVDDSQYDLLHYMGAIFVYHVGLNSTNDICNIIPPWQ